MQLKKGSKVLVKTTLKEHKTYGNNVFCSAMIPYLGKELTIKTCFEHHHYSVLENEWNWTHEMFENIEDLDLPDILKKIFKDGK